MQNYVLFLFVYIALAYSSYSQENKSNEVFASKNNEDVEEEMEAILEHASPFFYTNLDSTTYYANRFYELASSINDLNSQLGILNQLIISDNYFYDLKSAYRDLNRMDSLITKDPGFDTLTNGPAYYKFLVSTKGNYYFKTNNLAQSKEYFYEVLELTNTPKDSLTYFDAATRLSTLEFLGEIAKKQNKLALAEQYYTQTKIELTEYKYQNWENQLKGINNKLSKILVEKGDYNQANKLAKNSLAHYQKLALSDPKFKNSLKSTYKIVIENYIQQDSLEKAMSYIKESKTIVTDEDPFDKQINMLAGDIWLKRKAYDKAEHYYKKALGQYQKYFGFKNHADVAEIFSKLGNLEVLKNQPLQALNLYQKAFAQLTESTISLEYTDNPKVQEVTSKLILIKVLNDKTNALVKQYEISNEKEYLTAALRTSLLLTETLDALIPEYETRVDKEFLISQMYPGLQNAVQISYELYKLSKDEVYLSHAFYFIEKSKAILLLEATRNSYAYSYGGVPEKVINQERQYRTSINLLEKRIFIASDNQSLKEELFQVRSAYYDFIKSIESTYPRYYNLKYKSEVTSLEKLSKDLEGDVALLNYFVTDKSIFLVVVQKNKKRLYRFNFSNALKREINEFYNEISHFDFSKKESGSPKSYAIYEALVLPALKGLDATNLIIVADDILSYLPFDALTATADGGRYLLEDYQVSYANSATLLAERKKNDNVVTGDLLAFAPDFTVQTTIEQFGDRSQFAPLKYNGIEVEKISAHFDTKPLVGRKASLTNFNQHASAYGLLHFATHASANDEYPDYSYLALSSDKHPDSINFLYVKDLYAKELNASLVTLSACETGIGKFQKGEGMLSLARGFDYAGVQALVTSLWKVNDESTTQLMEYFYDNLSQGQAKDEALRNAKLTYLKNTDDQLLKHPYYWAGFVISGDMAPIKQPYYWWLGVFVLVAMIVIGFMIIRRKKA
ncbi:CHAT domain-containing protein [Aquimarina brevivitae]|uniref:CHAT domain-containing protein n=1 Tax=Aquimarina brevivitae TaxID=323412 RepID=A0A4Q7PEV4_9FLAO|nr:CHAT domain-containing tetratricopeptide repeat protein [Aquimarina brevivitae]RZS99003.1 CHAT domain-containing protein [Aquimarina brevivitae]